MGGVYAVPNIRGGGEYGAEWHQAAMKTKRQVAFDDFIAAAQWLIENKYTRPAKLAIEGASNGGLMVAAILVQRPELFGACLCEVPLTDMLRYHKFTDGTIGTPEFGSPDVPEEFAALRAYSPYHNVKPGTHYPPTLITTADTDDRAVPMHSYKFAAALQHAQSGAAPILIRIEKDGGHGDIGKPTTKRIEEAADQLTFVAQALGIRWNSPPEKK
jgi:prolyl oligopeptidase